MPGGYPTSAVALDRAEHIEKISTGRVADDPRWTGSRGAMLAPADSSMSTANAKPSVDRQTSAYLGYRQSYAGG